MARKISVEIVASSAQLERTFGRASRSAKGFTSDISKASRGAVAGSGAFRALGRSIAFASGAFLGAAGLSAAVSGAFAELNESNRVTAQTNAALKSTGAVAGVTAEQIDELGQALLRKTGIDDEAIRSAENLLLTFTNVRNETGKGNDIFDQATKAVLDMSVAMDEDLSAASIRVGKALQDPVKGATALRRVGVLLTDSQEKQIKAFVRAGRILDAQKIILRELTREFGGSAAAAGRVQPWNLLRETLRNLSAQGVQILLPQIIEITDRFQKWLDNTENQQRVLADAQAVFSATATVIGDIARIVGTASDAVGGFKNLVVILIGLKVVSTMAKWTIAVRTFGVAAGETGAAGAIGLLLTRLRALARIGVLSIAIRFPGLAAALSAIASIPGAVAAAAGAAVLASSGAAPNVSGFPTEGPGFTAQRLAREGQIPTSVLVAGAKAAGLDPSIPAARAFANPQFVAFVLKWAKSRGLIPAGVSAGGAADEALVKARRGLGLVKAQQDATTTAAINAASKQLSATQRNTFFDNAIARILLRGGLGTIQDQIGALQRADALISARLKVTKDVTRRLGLEDQLLQNEAQIRSLRLQQAADATQAAQDAKQKLLDAIQKAAEARNTRQFRALGLTSTGDEPVPGVGALRRALGNVSDQIKGTFLDTAKTKSMLDRIRTVLSGGLGAVGRDVRSKIQQILGDLNRQLEDMTSKNLTKWRHLSSQAFLAGIPNLTPALRRELAARFSTVSAGGRVPARTPAFAGAGARPMHLADVYLDGEKVGQITHSHGIRRDRRRSVPRGG